jgi:hypothetical protein
MLIDATEAPGRVAQAVSLLTDNGEVGAIGTVLGAAGLWLIGALLAAALVRRLLRPARMRLRHAASDRAIRIAGYIIEGLIVDLAPAVTYLAAGMAIYHFALGRSGRVLVGSEVFHQTASAVLVNSVVAWIAAVVLAVPLAANRPGLRLLPLDDDEARVALRFLRRVIVIGAASWLVAESLFLVWFGDGVPRLILLAASIVIGVLCLHALRRMSRLTHFERMWRYLAVASVFGLIVTWAHGLLLAAEPPIGRVLGTLGILAAMPLVDGMIRLMLGRVRRHLAAVVAPPRRIFAPDESDADGGLHAVEQPLDKTAQEAARAETERALDALIQVMHDAADTVLVIAAAVLLAHTWSLYFLSLLDTGEARTFLGKAVDAAASLAVGWYASRLIETGLS